MTEPQLRLFIGVGFPGPVLDHAECLVKALRVCRADVRWIPRENLHLTLAFLGPVAEELVPGLADLLDRTAADVPPAELEIGGLGTFGRPRRPSVVWLGIENPDGHLLSMREHLYRDLLALGFELEARAFQPHLTLGRVKGSRGLDALTSAMALANNTRFGRVGIGAVRLYKSTLTPQGSRYEILHEATLKGVSQDG